MKYRITTWLAAALMLSSLHATAASLSDIQVSNGDQQARITLSFVGEPEYSFTPQGKRLLALDIKQTGVFQVLPLQSPRPNPVKSICAFTLQYTQTSPPPVVLTEDVQTRPVTSQNLDK
ncbi:N-acetylmuramoyl-L-alanine amidase AmiB, partial [Escherichia coli]|nr:N-acetylmuramoyl-L-alanine amidase AmiB [Escherichia coli]